MMRLMMTITQPDLSTRARRRAYSDALDSALIYHRIKYMPLHFKKVALYRYPEYNVNKPPREKGRLERRKKDNRDGRTRLTRQQARVEQSRIRAEREAKGLSARAAKLPLVKSGFTRMRILQGAVKFSGRYDKRKITYQAPRYIYQNPPKTLDKAAALNAITKQEEAKLSEVAGEKFEQNLKRTEQTKGV